MKISSRTPEGFPSKCPLCGASTNLDFSEPVGDAPCPNCGCLVWLSASVLSAFQHQFAGSRGVASDAITADTAFVDLGMDSLETVELVMELEEEFGISIPDDEVQRIRTIGDMIRSIQKERRERGG